MTQVSIIVPSYNHGQFLMDRLTTIANQTYKDWEAIIIDDKSTDNSVEIITNFIKDNPTFKVKHFIINEDNSGSGYNSWQKGIELAETEYIWIAETDDYSDEKFLEDQVKVLKKNPSCSLSFCASNYVNSRGEFLYDSNNRTADLNTAENSSKVFSGQVFLNRMPFNTYITNGSSVVFKKPDQEIPDDIFLHKQISDIFLWTFLLKNSSFVFLNKKLNYFRQHEGSTSLFLQTNKLELIYQEIAEYLSFFEQTHKYSQFIDHYIKYYIWNNKKDFFNTTSIRKISINKNLDILYFYRAIKYLIKKILKL